MAEKSTGSDTAGLVAIDQAARLLMIGAERVRQLIKAGYIPRERPGFVSLVGAVQGYIKFRDDAERRSTKTAADSEVRRERAREIKMRNDERERKLIPIEDATAALDFLVGTVRESTNSIPARVTRDLELRRKIEAEVNAAQESIAKALSASADVVAKGGELPFSGAAD